LPEGIRANYYFKQKLRAFVHIRQMAISIQTKLQLEKQFEFISEKQGKQHTALVRRHLILFVCRQ
jgi:hypothetical protein